MAFSPESGHNPAYNRTAKFFIILLLQKALRCVYKVNGRYCRVIIIMIEMKRIVVLALVAVSLIGVACAKKIRPVSGDVVTREIKVSAFDEIQINAPVNVKFTQGASTGKAVVKGSSPLVEHLVLDVRGDKLIIRYEGLGNNVYVSNGEQGVCIELSSPELTELKMSSASSFSATSISGKNFEVEMSGASAFKVNTLSASYTEFDISGASNIDVANLSGTELDLDVSGASKIDISSAELNKLNMDISGASNIELDNVVTKTASIDVSGASHVDISGRCDVADIGCSGCSNVNARKFKVDRGSVEVSGMSKIKAYIRNVTSQSSSGMSTLVLER